MGRGEGERGRGEEGKGHGDKGRSTKATAGSVRKPKHEDPRPNPVPAPAYCPHCTNPLAEREDGGRPRRACPDVDCGYVHYDNPVPVVAALVEHEGCVILTQSKGWPADWFGLVAGFPRKRRDAPRPAPCARSRRNSGCGARSSSGSASTRSSEKTSSSSPTTSPRRRQRRCHAPKPAMPRHPNKEIRAAVEEALTAGWTLRKSGPRAHAWGVLYCPAAERGACKVSVFSTPRVPRNEASKIRRRVRQCPHSP